MYVRIHARSMYTYLYVLICVYVCIYMYKDIYCTIVISVILSNLRYLQIFYIIGFSKQAMISLHSGLLATQHCKWVSVNEKIYFAAAVFIRASLNKDHNACGLVKGVEMNCSGDSVKDQHLLYCMWTTSYVVVAYC